MYFRLKDFKTPEMAEGSMYHDEWKEETLKTQCLPKVFGGQKLNKPIVEKYIRVPLTPYLDISGRIDCMDLPVIYEYKTGSMSSEAHLNSYQGGMYAVLVTKWGYYVDRVILHRYNQARKEKDMSLIWVTSKLLTDTVNWIVTVGSEIHDYCLQNQLYEKFDTRRSQPRN